MDTALEQNLEWLFANLMYFFKGGLTYSDLNNMPIPEVLRYNDYAKRINKDQEQASKRR
jgi:hypothetical protein